MADQPSTGDTPDPSVGTDIEHLRGDWAACAFEPDARATLAALLRKLAAELDGGLSRRPRSNNWQRALCNSFGPSTTSTKPDWSKRPGTAGVSRGESRGQCAGRDRTCPATHRRTGRPWHLSPITMRSVQLEVST